MHTKRISSGLYTGEYKGVNFEISKVEEINSATKSQWYWKIGKEGGHDWYNKKSIALQAVKEFIEEKN